MAIKTFTTGEVLTAADTNTYLANSGLVHIKSQTNVGSNSTITVTNAFSSIYDNYYITLTGATLSVAAAIGVQLGPSSVLNYNTTYYAGIMRVTNAAVAAPLGTNNGSNWNFMAIGSTNGVTMAFKLYEPFLARPTRMFTEIVDVRPADSWGSGGGVHDQARSYTDFLIAGGANIIGGTVDVYGYRKA